MTCAPTSLRALTYSPTVNPFGKGITIAQKKRAIRTGSTISRLYNPETGSFEQAAEITRYHTIETEEFVKVFTDGIARAFNLSKTAQRVFQALLDLYAKQPMSRGYTDTIALAWVNGGINGEPVDMSAQTFRRGLREIIDAQFIAPAVQNVFWVNPALFFKGNRVRFISDYTKNSEGAETDEPAS